MVQVVVVAERECRNSPNHVVEGRNNIRYKRRGSDLKEKAVGDLSKMLKRLTGW